MRIYIPTRGRYTTICSDSTLSRLPEDLRVRTTIVTHEEDWSQYKARIVESGWSVEVLSAGSYESIGQKRHYIGSVAQKRDEETFAMLDDDIDFLVRRGDDVWNLRAAEDSEIVELFNSIEELLDEYAEVGVSSREGQNRWGVGSKEQLVFPNTRLMRFVAFRTDDFMSVEHGRVRVMEDFDVTLQLLRRGRPNALVAYWANGQRQTQQDGGCSIWRTHEIHEEAARRLADLHPGLVSLRQKNNKSGGEFGSRTEVTVQWKKAYGHG